MKKRSGILIQARMSSSRLPNKMLMKIGNYSLIEYVVRRCNVSKKADLVAVITSNDPSDDSLFQFCQENDISIFRGPLDDVLERYVQAAVYFGLDIICRVCGDSPFVDIHQIDKLLDHINAHYEYDYISMINVVDGFLAEVFKSALLRRVNKLNISKEDREHVSLYVRNCPQKFKVYNIDMGMDDLSQKISLTVDTLEDLKTCNLIANTLVDNGDTKKFDFKTHDVMNIVKKLAIAIDSGADDK